MDNRVGMIMLYKRHELKPIHMLIGKYEDCHIRHDGGWEFPTEGWTINISMTDKFGDGKKHRFARVDEEGPYTHRHNDGYYYSEEWFVDTTPIIVLDEKDFLL